MDIKRRLNKIAKCMTPEIEIMNVAQEMARMCSRLEELVAYADEKIARSKERKGISIGQRAVDLRAAADKEITDHQTAESDANLADQKESFDERNKKAGIAVESKDSVQAETLDVVEKQAVIGEEE